MNFFSFNYCSSFIFQFIFHLRKNIVGRLCWLHYSTPLHPLSTPLSLCFSLFSLSIVSLEPIKSCAKKAKKELAIIFHFKQSLSSIMGKCASQVLANFLLKIKFLFILTPLKTGMSLIKQAYLIENLHFRVLQFLVSITEIAIVVAKRERWLITNDVLFINHLQCEKEKLCEVMKTFPLFVCLM